MGQFGAGGSVFGATAGAEPGNFHVLLSHVATLELSLGGVPKKKRRENGRKGRGRGAVQSRTMETTSPELARHKRSDATQREPPQGALPREPRRRRGCLRIDLQELTTVMTVAGDRRVPTSLSE